MRWLQLFSFVFRIVVADVMVLVLVLLVLLVGGPRGAEDRRLRRWAREDL